MQKRNCHTKTSSSRLGDIQAIISDRYKNIKEVINMQCVICNKLPQLLHCWEKININNLLLNDVVKTVLKGSIVTVFPSN